MAFTTIDKSSLHFNTKLYTGNGSTQSITGVGFQPDLVWTKERGGVCDHHIFDVIRGATYKINSASTEASSADANTLTAFTADGFNVGTNACQNNSSDTFTSWNWKAGNSAGSSNTDGSINTTATSVNTTAGFSISKYTGTGSAATVGHGLGAVPKMIMVKKTSGAESWGVYHNGIGNTHFLQLNTTGASSDNAVFWNDTDPTSSVFTINTDAGVNGSGQTYIAYAFTDIIGFSKFGTYNGNGNANGTFIYTGFKPAWLMIKRTDSTDSWFMYDNKRSSFNVVDDYLIANSSNAESTSASVNMDFLSNGVKIRNTDGGHNNSSGTYIYMAFAEAPLVGSNNVPCTAR